ncbi:hypothetical protein MRB53_034550 [Persea americana]|uniref:Uncharacterized protein n=1 Tax=Persea americana TaxID=3435 RepID=A0ACC2K2M0_PERAE|nr:hypothetical protein MRB53_034550 [Persea americana]
MYVEHEQFEQALTLFNKMKYSGLDHDEFSFVSVLAARTSLSWPRMGKAVNGNLIKTGLVPGAFVGSSLIDIYANFGVISDAKQVFNKVEHRDLIAWNSMIVGSVQNDNGNEALKLLCSMWEENVEPDNFTFAGVLAGFADITAIQQGRQLNAMVLKSRIPADTAVANSLITMYASVGSLKEAEKVFSKLMTKNVVSWTAMVGGHAHNGYAKEPFELFEKMKNFQMNTNGITFVALLTACSHVGLTEQAKMFFHMMEFEYQSTPDIEHYACMVDVLGRAGRLKEAEELINKMPHEPNALVWRMLLGASRIHGDSDRGKRGELEPGVTTLSSLLLSGSFISSLSDSIAYSCQHVATAPTSALPNSSSRLPPVVTTDPDTISPNNVTTSPTHEIQNQIVQVGTTASQLPHSASQLPPPALPTSTDQMVTRSKSGISKKKIYLCTKHPTDLPSSDYYDSFEPASFIEVSKSTAWRQALSNEFSAL